MDPALQRERELFMKRAYINPTVEKKRKDPEGVVKDERKKAKPVRATSATPLASAPTRDLNIRGISGVTQHKFTVLAKIVKHMKQRHQLGDDHPLTIDEILDETNQLDVGSKVKQWLLTEALVQNPKLEQTPEGGFLFKPPYKIRDRRALLRLLKQQDLKGLGGILLDDVQESLPHCEKALKILQNEIIYVARPLDKKKVLFYNDRTAQLDIDEEFQKLWRGIAVESVDDDKIEEYLEKQGISSMQDHGPTKPLPKRKKVNNRKKTQKKPRDNEHLADVLVNYEDN